VHPGLLEGLSGARLEAMSSALLMPLMPCRIDSRPKALSKCINPALTPSLTSNQPWFLRVRSHLPSGPFLETYPGGTLLLAVCFFIILIFLVTHNFVEFNQRIYVHEEGDWVVKGRYNDAIADDEDVEWSVADGKLALFLCAVRPDFLLLNVDLSLSRKMKESFLLALVPLAVPLPLSPMLQSLPVYLLRRLYLY
jgi:hypothetical protein